MKIVLLTNEYPPNVYGGAGVHIDFLSKALARLDDCIHSIRVFCFGNQELRQGNLWVTGIGMPSLRAENQAHSKALEALSRSITMAGLIKEADVVHCHTWYSHFGGILARTLHGVPLVLTTHSLEPHRPWKAEQLGTAYELTKWVERTAYENADGIIAVSRSMKADVHHLYGVPLEKVEIIHNGIDPTVYRPVHNPEVLQRYGINPSKPFILFVGRITRQKGITHLVNAIEYINKGVQVVLCAGAPDTEEIAVEMKETVERARTRTSNEIVWIPEIVPVEELLCLYTHADLFVCPSVYEPFGLINLEAMACGTPVVASAVGGITEVVVPGETGLLVPFEAQEGGFEPGNSARFSKDLAKAINELLDSPETLRRMGELSRKRIEENFTWSSVARKTLEFYRSLQSESKSRT
jgi:glycogen synthase